MLGHVIVFNGEPEIEWKQLEEQSSKWDFHVHIDQALAVIVAIHL